MTVSYIPSHENNVDTSVENNPSYVDDIYPNVREWSIIKRKRKVNFYIITIVNVHALVLRRHSRSTIRSARTTPFELAS